MNGTTNPRPTSGYAITGYKQVMGRDGYAFQATLTLNGKKVLSVSNDGNGSSNDYRPLNADGYKTLAKDLSAAEAAANLWAAGTEWEGYVEVIDLFVDELIEIARLNRKRSWVVMFDDEDYFGDCTAFEASGNVPLARLLQDLSRPQNAARTPRVWDKTTSTFRLASDMLKDATK